MTDPRLDPLHPDHIGRAAYRHITAQQVAVASPIAPMHKTPHKDAMRISELLYGETATIHAELGDFYLIQARHDNYVGYSPKSHFCPTAEFGEPEWQVQVAAAPLFAAPDIKSPILEQLSGGSAIALNPPPPPQEPPQQHEDYVPVRLHLHNKPHTAYIHRAYIHRAHIAPPKKLKLSADSLIREARRYLGLPYIWGGRSFRGLDCSGLIQQVLAAHGIAAPRDSDMQAGEVAGEIKGISPIGTPAERITAPQKGDICFWHGHVGIFTGSHLIHAYGGSCLVSEDAAKNIFPRLKSATNNDMRIVRCLI